MPFHLYLQFLSISIAQVAFTDKHFDLDNFLVFKYFLIEKNVLCDTISINYKLFKKNTLLKYIILFTF